MALTFTDLSTKFQRLTKSNNADVLTQGQQDMNIGYHLFNAQLARYYTQKQEFASLVANQQLYQTPVDSIRIITATVLVSNTFTPPLQEVRDEYEWRLITSYTYATNWPAWYRVLGNDTISLWPVPSQSVTNGLRYIYQPQDHDLSIADVTSTSTDLTVTVANGSTTVTASGSAFTTDMVGLWFQVTGQVDLTWYEIVGATPTTLTLKSKYIASSGSSKAWRVGQLSIIPQEYSDAPLQYGLYQYWSAQGDEPRSQLHLGNFNRMVKSCKEEYSSSNSSSVIADGDNEALNVWLVPPPASPV